MRRESEFRLFTFSFSGRPASDDLRGGRRSRKPIVLHPRRPSPHRFRRNFLPGSHRGSRDCECPHGNRCRGFPNCFRRLDCYDDFRPDDEPSAGDGLQHRRSGRILHRPSHEWPGIAHGTLHPSPRPAFSTPGRYPPESVLKEHQTFPHGFWICRPPVHRILLP